MRFLSYSLGYYRRELQALAGARPSGESVYRARQLLKMLDDLADEGYTELGERLEAACGGLSFLYDYLRAQHAEPFALPEGKIDGQALPCEAEERELGEAIRCAAAQAMEIPPSRPAPFIERLRGFCRWIGYDEGTSYIFLLRDALLPYVCFLGQGRTRISPWLLSRKSFAEPTGDEHADDELRAAVYRALETGCADFQAFTRRVLPDMRETVGRYPRASEYLASMLTQVDARRIVVVESGCCGTFPLLLMSLDSRADMRMYTTYPYLTDVYAGRVYTARYEENRLFETMASQEAYFRFAGLRNGQFYVRKCADAAIERRALAEIRGMLTKQEEK